ncbi:uncharacterized protein FIBRA_08706 [Fibroporia radiculosa]|uniref:F-box domain-containing protein n=1 Tax=Fibroporia radiculosa TaxID=599839 RepID=J4GI34_9APHY|nr:uncharacterized protein FIBRA_08706 [Fibroporia radiculosa]CCM06443.1 predicted protein [Fibroporia radiculosa]
MDVALACSPQDAHSVADRDELEGVATAGADGNVRSSCWDASIVERTFSQLCDTCPVVSSRLPTELWERIIDFIADHHLYDVGSFGRVCRGWYLRCRFHSHNVLEMWNMDKKQIYRLINALGKRPERRCEIKTVAFDFDLKSIVNFGSFAVRMVQKLPRVDLLQLCD